MNTLFALDIGTRSVVGIVLREQNNSFHVVELISKEHKERSMIDGQIHNIVSVAAIIEEIKEELKERHGGMKQVSVAAAGRSLKTAQGIVSVDISENALISDEDISRLELAAVQNAQQSLLEADQPEDDQYYCVGYSVLHYKLNGEEIGNLIDQTGEQASVEVIATFLPRVVVESLLAALKRADLEMEALTLEPIAAIQALVPKSMRRLNIALVDIGAGTSDIAIADENTVTAYGMVPVAGDEITEALSSHYLLDFPGAEQLKRQIRANDSLSFTDILGNEQQLAKEEVTAIIAPAVGKLAAAIAEEIKKLNAGNAPQAVMVVGGGSLTPTLTEQLSAQLGLPENRVAIRGLDALADVTLDEAIESSPALVTPIGIAIAAKRAPIHYMTVSVNGKPVRLFELKEMTVGDALLAAHISARRLYGRPGLALTVSVNGKWTTLPGEHGTSAVILRNGEEVSTKDPLHDGDSIDVQFGVDGKDAQATVHDVVETVEPIEFTLGGQLQQIETAVLLNSKPAAGDTVLADRDELIVHQRNTLAAALKQTAGKQQESLFSIIWDGKAHTVKSKPPVYTVNGEEITVLYKIQNGDQIESQPAPAPTLNEIADELGITIEARADVTFNGQPVTVKKQRTAVYVNGQLAQLSYRMHDRDHVEFKTVSDAPIMFSDIFSFTDFSLPAHSAAVYRLLRNGESIRFNETIFGGDRLEIRFE